MMTDSSAGEILSCKDQNSYPIRKAFQLFYPDYLKSHFVSAEQSKAARCISSCKTGDFGYNVSYCKNCGHTEIHACSCNNRNCPNCQAPLEKKWVMARNSEMIDGCAYYHVVFTIPSELNALMFQNQKELYSLLFSSVQKTLLTLSRDKKYLGAVPGILMVLHTWGQKLNYHPHIHCCISGGGLTGSNQFVESSHKHFFLPVQVIGKMFRGKFLDGLKHLHAKGMIHFSGGISKLHNSYEWNEFISGLYSKDWIPFIKETFNGNGNAVEYLARYAFRTAISNSRITAVTNETVTFRYKDYADHNTEKKLTVKGTEFIRLFLQHILPKGFSRIRFAGFLSNCCKSRKLKLIHRLRGTVYKENPVKGLKTAELLNLLYGKDILHCPECSCEMHHYRSRWLILEDCLLYS